MVSGVLRIVAHQLLLYMCDVFYMRIQLLEHDTSYLSTILHETHEKAEV